MSDLTYERLLNENDPAVPCLKKIFELPEISKYISIGENYFRYVTDTPDVYFYKIYDHDRLIGSIHLEKQGETLFMDILVFPEFQGVGVGKTVLKDIQTDIFQLDYKKIEIAIDESNIASLSLFENAGFIRSSKDDELISFIYQRIVDE